METLLIVLLVVFLLGGGLGILSLQPKLERLVSRISPNLRSLESRAETRGGFRQTDVLRSVSGRTISHNRQQPLPNCNGEFVMVFENPAFGQEAPLQRSPGS